MKPRTAKDKGRETEQAFADYLIANGIPYAERRHLNGVLDRGDIAGWVGVCVEVKSGGGANLELGTWMRELAYETANDGADYSILVIRPRGKPDPKDWWAVMPVPQAVALIERPPAAG